MFSSLQVYMAADGGKELKAAPTVITGAERKSLDELQRDLEDQRELSSNRLVELESLQGNYKECLQEGTGTVREEGIKEGSQGKS